VSRSTWHIVLRNTRTGRLERLASLELEDAIVARLTAAGRSVKVALDAERRRWAAVVRRAGYVEGWVVEVVDEQRGGPRLFPGVDLSPKPRPSIVLPPGYTPRRIDA
jgi:hypothetical protein